MAHSMRRGVGLVLGTLLSAGCGNGDDYDPNVGDVQRPATVEMPPPSGDGAPSDQASNGEAPSEPSPPPVTAEMPPPVSVPPVQPEPTEEETEASGSTACKTPNGVSGRPTNLEETIILLNTLPRPTSLACFLEALERPLQLYLTRSNQSLQPSPGARSPRTFIVNEPLVMSIVLEGAAAATLEIGYRTEPRRSVKTEILFPLTQDVTTENFFDEVKLGQVTRCSACHTSERLQFNEEFNAEVYESDIFEPYEVYEVDLASLRTEREICDPAAEPERCALLSALFDHGDVEVAPEGIMFTTP